MSGQGNSFEEARPWTFRPEEMPRAEPMEVKPLIREQAFPEKDDGRFFDRWVMDWAEALGSRAVKWRGLEKLGEGVLKFARWRSLRHEANAERESQEDRQTIASTQARIEKAEGEVTQLELRARSEEQEVEHWRVKADESAEQRAELRPALRGAKWWDLILCAIAQIVILTVDLFVFHRSLGQIPGSDGEHWGTAGSMGAGAVVVGDILGWLAAAGTVRSKGGFSRPRRPVVIAIAAILIIAVWFFADLGSFREHALSVLRDEGEKQIGKPSFFTLAQILFLLGAASSFFAYLARREGRDLLKRQSSAEVQRNKAREAVVQLRNQLAAAARAIGEAPVLREAAMARLESRAKEAEANAALDLEQGAYLYDLIVPAYMRARANVEIGAYHWVANGHTRPSGHGSWWLSMRARLVAAGLATLALAGAAFFIAQHSVAAAIFTAVIVAAALALTGLGSETPSGDDEDDGRADIFTAKFPPPTPPSYDERATDIVGLEQLSTNGHGEPFAEERMDGFDETA
jgi:hypothetical protein